MSVAAVGYAAGGLAAFFNGTYAVPFKTKAVKDAKLHPIYFQLYVSTGVSFACLLFAAFLSENQDFMLDSRAGGEFVIVPLAVLSGVLFVTSIVPAFYAIPRIGLSRGWAVWGTVSILTSFLLAVAKNGIGSVILAIVAIIMLCSGVALIAFCEAFATMGFGAVGTDTGEQAYSEMRETNSSRGVATERDSDSTSSLHRGSMRETFDEALQQVQPNTDEVQSRTEVIKGFGYAVTVGFSGGSFLFPMQFAAPDQQGLASLPGFAVGCICTSLLVTGLFVLSEGSKNIPPFQLAQTLRSGLFAGLLWNIGNVCTMFSIARLGFAVAYTLFHCAILVAGLWGIFVFKEIRRPQAIAIFLAGGCLLIGGTMVLARAETG
jgi:glucose uptake protein GlcU